METQEQTLPAEIVNAKLVEIVQTAPAILRENKSRHDKAIAYGNNLLNKAEESGMNDELDILMAEYQQKLRVTYKTINEARKPFTQIVDEVKKEFTALEADIDPVGKTNIFFNIQRVRNIYVTAKIEAQKAKEAEALRKQNIEKEKVEIQKQVDIEINEAFARYIYGVKSAMNNIFEGITLETVELARKSLNAVNVNLSKEIFNSFAKKHFFVNYIEPLEVEMIIAGKKTDALFNDLNDVCGIELIEYKKELIEKIPSKVNELEAIANAKEEESIRLQKLADDRKLAEEETLAKEVEQKTIEAAQIAEVDAAGKNLTASVAIRAELFQGDAPKMKEGYAIEVKNPAGYGLIFMFWFEKEGKGLPADKIERKTIGQMKAFCESHALKTDEKIENPMIVYKETYKAQ